MPNDADAKIAHLETEIDLLRGDLSVAQSRLDAFAQMARNAAIRKIIAQHEQNAHRAAVRGKDGQ